MVTHYDAHVNARLLLIMEYFRLPTALPLDSTTEEEDAVQARRDEIRRLIQGER